MSVQIVGHPDSNVFLIIQPKKNGSPPPPGVKVAFLPDGHPTFGGFANTHGRGRGASPQPLSLASAFGGGWFGSGSAPPPPPRVGGNQKRSKRPKGANREASPRSRGRSERPGGVAIGWSPPSPLQTEGERRAVSICDTEVRNNVKIQRINIRNYYVVRVMREIGVRRTGTKMQDRAVRGNHQKKWTQPHLLAQQRLGGLTLTPTSPPPTKKIQNGGG